MTNSPIVRAGLLLIGDELLSGRTQDANLTFLAQFLNEIGIQVFEVRIIPDVIDTIVEAVNEYRTRFDYVFTTGGIGPTHDDLTIEAIAKAFGAPLEINPQAHQMLSDFYSTQGGMNDARLKMAIFPKGSEIIFNKVSGAPGFKIENVFVMAGIPTIMQAMIEAAKPFLKGGRILKNKIIVCYSRETLVAHILTDLQNKYQNQVALGSYPFHEDTINGTKLVLRSDDLKILNQASEELFKMLESSGNRVEYEIGG